MFTNWIMRHGKNKVSMHWVSECLQRSQQTAQMFSPMGRVPQLQVTVGWYLQGVIPSLLTYLEFSLISEINVFVMQPNLKFLAYMSILFKMWLFIIICFVLIRFNSELLYRDHYIFLLAQWIQRYFRSKSGPEVIILEMRTWGYREVKYYVPKTHS